ncbi:hypothetical protein AB0E64_21915 [Streptomyces caelestis]|uniref:Uncharacterized protein n=1 Tax=Streptomyces caelestis TaxID=36816 RepID=A0A7W9H2Z0_9ACTN|nr:hypothetical protein [Streptomyces caelestis]MBB5794767.1 hypothetical protein [Streptomyces caelestis]GGW28373.1 hypothetical protein GCM10010320_04040 [Streptomyces caelestis]
MTARNDDRREAGSDGDEYGRGAYPAADGDGVEYEGADYDGMDALMAALVGAPLPEGARRDPDFTAAHHAAATDVALLRRQLLLIGDTLARAAGAEAGAADAERVAGARAPGEAGDQAERAPAAGAADGAAVEHAGGSGAAAGSGVGASERVAGARARGEAGDPDLAAGAAAGSSPAHAVGSGAAPDPTVTALPVRFQGEVPLDDEEAGHESGRAVGQVPPARPGRGDRRSGSDVVSVSPAGRRSRPRPLVVALRGLAAAVAVTVVVGMGWLVVQSGHGAGEDSAGSSAADTAAGPQHGQEGAKLGHAGYLACARIVAEGTVAEVEPVPGTGQDRVTLDVERSYKPAKGQDRIVFPMDEDAAPQPRPGERVLVGITRGQAQPDLWSVGEKEIATVRAWITAALSESGTLPCA